MSLPKSIGIKLYDDSFVPVLTEGEIKSKKVTLTTVRDNQKKAIIELYEGTSDKCIHNEFLGKLLLELERDSDKGDPAFEVHLRLDEDGMLFAKAWDIDTGQETGIKIEHSMTERIFPETLSDEEIDNLGEDTHVENIVTYTDEEDFVQYDNEPKKKSPVLRIIILIIVLLALLGGIGVGAYFGYRAFSKFLEKQKTEGTNGSKTEDELKRLEEEKKRQEELKKQQEEEARRKKIEEDRLKKQKELEEAQKQKELQAAEDDKKVMGTKEANGTPYKVRPNDNLWNICKKTYNDPWYYPALADANNLKNPRLIHPGQKLILPAKIDLRRWNVAKNKFDD